MDINIATSQINEITSIEFLGAIPEKLKGTKTNEVVVTPQWVVIS